MKKILIVCGAGASSGFMSKNIRLELKKRGMTADFEFIARSDTASEIYAAGHDRILQALPYSSLCDRSERVWSTRWRSDHRFCDPEIQRKRELYLKRRRTNEKIHAVDV